MNTKELLQHITKGNVTVTFRQAVVKSVDYDTDSCVVAMVNGEADRQGVHLRSTNGSKDIGLVCYPKVGSYVTVGCIDDNVNFSFVELTDEIDVLMLVIDGNKMRVDKNLFQITWKQIQFNDGSNDGLVLIKKLVSHLNSIESTLNNHINTYNTHTHPTSSPGSPTAPTTAIDTSHVTTTQQSDIENTKIKQ